MGGVEFGAPLLQSTELKVEKDGSAKMTLSFGTSSVTIYTLKANTFVSETYFYGGDKTASFGIEENGTWNAGTYTLSESASVQGNSSAGKVNSKYVTSMTVPVTNVSNTYNLAMGINSDVMGMQFGGASSTYPATLTVNWSNVTIKELVKEQYTINVVANDEKAGTVTGGTTVEEGTEVTVKAEAKEGYTFKNWTENESVISNDAEYTFTANANRSLTAVFEVEKTENDHKDVIAVSSLTDLKAGTYGLSSKLSCYVSAMGGVEFGEPLLSNATMQVAEDGTTTVTLKFTTSTVNIYGVIANTYVSAEGMVQYWNGSAWVDAAYTTDANGYVTTMTFPITEINDTYKLALMVGSNVMGTQFGGADSKYDATWSVDWKNVTVGELFEKEDKKDESSNTGNGSSNTTNNGASNTGNGSSNTTNNGSSATTSTSPKGTIISVNSLSGLKAGSYGLSASLSCYVNAMGGVEFGNSLLSSAVLNVAEDGTAAITLTFKTSSVTIYGVTANTYVANEGKIQYWNGSAWVNATYTTDANGYVATMTFPITEISNTYKLALTVGSEVMGSQFGGDGSNYDAILTVDWNKVTVGGSGSTLPVTGDAAPILPIAITMLFAALLFGWGVYNKKKEQM